MRAAFAADDDPPPVEADEAEPPPVEAGELPGDRDDLDDDEPPF
jgi:hypothetical protein